MSVVQDAVQAVMKKALALAPDGWIPGGHPDPMMHHKHGLIGASISRIDGPLKVSGKAQFCAEFPMERLTYAALKYSTIARGRITEIDTAAAETAPGVVLVMTHRNAPKLNKAPPFMSKPKAAGPDDLPIMQDDRVHWNAQPVAIVLAETQEQAEHAQTLIRVTYEEQNPVTSLAAAKANGTEFWPVHGRAAEAKGRRRRGRARGCSAQSGCQVHDAKASSRSDRVARLHPDLGRRRAPNP